MARRDRVYDDDDGRTIADMSDVYSSPVLIPRRKRNHHTEPPKPSEEDWDPQDRKVYIFAALRAALMIALVYAVGFGLLIGLLLLIWRH